MTNFTIAGQFKAIPSEPGTYIIENTVNRRVYIGETGDLRMRFCVHVGSLRKGTHHNEALQADWNEFGEPAFTFSILTSPECIESHYVQHYGSDNPERGYNLPKRRHAEIEHANNVKALANLWGFTGKRYTNKTLARCIELAYQQLIVDA